MVASDLGRSAGSWTRGGGALFPVGNPEALAATVLRVLADPAGRERYCARASAFVRRFDWSAVTAEVLAVYEMALAASDAVIPVHEDPASLRGVGGWGCGPALSRREPVMTWSEIAVVVVAVALVAGGPCGSRLRAWTGCTAR
ncbi:hypothetical protein NKG05_27400 [Oerskovia sp. M15]